MPARRAFGTDRSPRSRGEGGRIHGSIASGGGQAGLGASYHLARHGIDHVVLERGRVGESWRSRHWDSFALSTPNWLNRLRGQADAIEPRDASRGRDAWIARLKAHRDDHGLPIRTGMEVAAVASLPGDGGFIVSAEDGRGSVELETRSVIVAYGLQRVPRIPALARYRLASGSCTRPTIATRRTFRPARCSSSVARDPGYRSSRISSARAGPSFSTRARLLVFADGTAAATPSNGWGRQASSMCGSIDPPIHGCRSRSSRSPRVSDDSARP